jgi:cytochrome c
MRAYFLAFSVLSGLLWLLCGCGPQPRPEVRLLVFSKTAGYRHASIPDGIRLIEQIAARKGWQVDTTENDSLFTEENLSRYSAVVFVSTTGDVLDYRQQADFRRYIQGGGGYVGIHAASDTEYEWPWYGRLVGAYFTSHPSNPNVRQGTMQIVNTDHVSTQFLTGRATWDRTDEFYNFEDIYHGPADGIVPLINIDEHSYEGGKNGEFHPMTWYHAYDGGRSWYTNFGHTAETYEEPDFIKLLEGGLTYAIGDNLPINYALATQERAPNPRRFATTVLATNLAEPTELTLLPDGRILWAQRRGELMLHDPIQNLTTQVGNLAVWNKFEDGLVGLALDPNFAQNHWLYLYYAPADSTPRFVLSRFEFRNDQLMPSTEQRILEVPVQRVTCCHTGGSIEFGPDGLLYLSTGDDTNPFDTRYAPIDEREGKEAYDAQRSSANPSDLRGKILRIKPMADGSYEIPAGNLFPSDRSQGRPEIYVMGCRNPYRISIDQANGFLYWGDVGPDGRTDSTRGPRGYDEVNQARQAGFFGWPYFIGNNYAYADVDFASQATLTSFDPSHPRNDSRHNLGIHDLPPAQPAFVWYPYAVSPDFPILGQGGRNAMAGPVYHHQTFAGASSQFPRYYDGKLFIYDFMRDWIMLVTMNDAGDLETIEPFLPADQLPLSSPTDMVFGPDGALYVITYGTKWFQQNEDAQLIRIDYSEVNRPPSAVAQVSPREGAVPLTVTLDGSRTMDYDPDESLHYTWTFPGDSQQQGEMVTYTFTEAGVYDVRLTVTDVAGNESETTIIVEAGNTPPMLSVAIDGNQEFFWREKPIRYQLSVEDQEDGSLAAGDIAPEAVAVSWEFGKSQYDPTEGAAGHAVLAEAAAQQQGLTLLKNQGCVACHGMAEKIIGPGYREVAARYRDQPDAVTYLSGKIINGGSGIWGGQAMPAMTQVTPDQAELMARYILELGDQPASLPATGTLVATQHNGLGEGNSYTLRATYQDRGAAPIRPLTRQLTQTFYSPKLEIEQYTDPETSQAFNVWVTKDRGVLNLLQGGHGTTYPLDLTGVKGLTMQYKSEVTGGTAIEVRLDSLNGPVIGQMALPETPGDDVFEIVRLRIQPSPGTHRLFFLTTKGQNLDPKVGPLLIDWVYLEPK